MTPPYDAQPPRSRSERLVIGLVVLSCGLFFIIAHFLVPGWDSEFARYMQVVGDLAVTLQLNYPSVVVGALLVMMGFVILMSLVIRRPNVTGTSLTLPPATATEARNTARIIMFYDVENQAFKAERAVGFVTYMHRMLPTTTVDAFGFYRPGEANTQKMIAALRDIGFHLIPVYNNSKNAVDQRIMLQFSDIIDQKLPGEHFHFILVTSDTDFIDLVKAMRIINHRVSVWAKTMDAPTVSKFQKAGADVHTFGRDL
jgi:hypothetical protein